MFSWGICQQIVVEGEWHTLNSIGEAINLLREYETNSIQSFLVTEGIKDSEKSVSLIFAGMKGV